MTLMDRDLCYRLNKNIELLVQRFAEKYWDDMPEITCVEEWSDQLHWNYYFNQEIYFNVVQMFTALWYNIPRAMLFAWFDIQCGNVAWTKMSLLNFYQYNTDGTINKTKRDVC